MSSLKQDSIAFVRARPAGSPGGRQMLVRFSNALVDAMLEVNRGPETRPEDTIQFGEGMLEEEMMCILPVPEKVIELGSTPRLIEVLRDTMWAAIEQWEEALKSNSPFDAPVKMGTLCLSIVPLIAQVSELRAKFLTVEGFLVAFVTLASATLPPTTDPILQAKFVSMGSTALSSVYAWVVYDGLELQEKLGSEPAYLEGVLDVLQNSLDLKHMTHIEESLDSMLDLCVFSEHRHFLSSLADPVLPSECHLCETALAALVERDGVNILVRAWTLALEKPVLTSEVTVEDIVLFSTCRMHIVTQVLYFLNALLHVESIRKRVVEDLKNSDGAAARLADCMKWDSWRSRSVRESISGSCDRINSVLFILECVGGQRWTLLAEDRKEVPLLNHLYLLPYKVERVKLRAGSSHTFKEHTAPELTARCVAFAKDVAEKFALHDEDVAQTVGMALKAQNEKNHGSLSRQSSVSSVLSMMSIDDMPPLPSCFYCGRTEKLRLCTGCRFAVYCSSDCQKKHWKVHQLECLPITKLRSSFGPSK